MSVVSGQPEVRFNAAGPMGLQGLSYEPKCILIEKTLSTAEGYDDVMAIPAGTYISDVFAVCDDGTGITTAEVSLGLSTATECLVTATDFSVETDNNAFHFHTGYYVGAAGTLRLTVGGTSAAGHVKFVMSYFELAAMSTNGKHFDL